MVAQWLETKGNWHSATWFKEVVRVARGRTIKFPPKRGKLTRSQVKRAVEKVVLGKNSSRKSTSSSRRKSQVTTFKVGRDAQTGRFITRKEAERRKATAIVETITIPKKKEIVSLHMVDSNFHAIALFGIAEHIGVWCSYYSQQSIWTRARIRKGYRSGVYSLIHSSSHSIKHSFTGES